MALKSKLIFNNENAKGWIPWGAIAPFIALVFILGPLVAIDVFILQPFGLTDENLNPIGVYGLISYLTLSFGVVGLIFYLWIHIVEKRSLLSVGLKGESGFKIFSQGFAIGLILVSLLVFLIWVMGGYEIGVLFPAFSSSISLFHIGLLAIGFTIQSSVEEFVFRGWLLSVLTRKFNVLVAIIVSSLLFTLMHFDTSIPWYNILISILFSLFACVWVMKTKNIWGVMGWHAGWNWFTSVGFEVPITGVETNTPALILQLKPMGSQLLNGGGVGPEGSLVCAAILAAATIYILRKK